MIDHVGVKTSNQAASRRFYENALAPLGYEVLMEFEEGRVVGMGIAGKPDFWFSPGESSGPIHLAFSAPDRSAEYHAGYYGAFAFDPDRNNVEAVFHDPSEMKKA